MKILVQKNGALAHVEESGVPNERDLQRFIFDNPESLPLGDIKEDNRLMIVGREFQTGSGPVDVLAIDGDGDVYVVETKLYKNPDKRRVIAQLLDYGAALWRGSREATTVISALEASISRQSGVGLQQSIENFYRLDEEEASDVIRSIDTNLRDGNFRFVVLMDHMDTRLRDLILFLNQRTQFDVYAVVMQFYRHEDVEIVIPKLFGAEVAKAVPPGGSKTRAWNEARFFEAAQEVLDAGHISAIRSLYQFSVGNADQVRWARGEHGAFRPQFKRPYAAADWHGKVGPLFTVGTDGLLSLRLGSLERAEQLKPYRDRFVFRLQEIGFPSIPNDLESDRVDIPVAEWAQHVDPLTEIIRDIFVRGDLS